jgi:integrase
MDSARPGAGSGQQRIQIPDRVSVELASLAGTVKEGLLAFAVGVGMQVFRTMLEEDVTAVAGPKGRHNPTGRVAYRHGDQESSVVLGGRRVAVSRPRVRGVAGGELALPIWEAFAGEELLGNQVMASLLAGISTRSYDKTLEPVGSLEASATSKSAVSRPWRRLPSLRKAAGPTPPRFASTRPGLAPPRSIADPLTSTDGRDWAMRDYRSHLQVVLKRSPATVNNALAAVDDFYIRQGLGSGSAVRVEIPAAAPRALGTRAQLRYLRAVQACPSPRDQALGLVPFYAGARIAEVVALDIDDVARSARKGMLRIYGKGERVREVPIHPQLHTQSAGWLAHRAGRLARGRRQFRPVPQPARPTAQRQGCPRHHHRHRHGGRPRR